MPKTDHTPTTDRAGHVCSTAELGLLPESDGEFYSWRGQYRVQSKAAYSAETVLRLLAAERERCAKLCDEVSREHFSEGMTCESNGAAACAARLRRA